MKTALKERKKYTCSGVVLFSSKLLSSLFSKNSPVGEGKAVK